jgi:hypothetical protein
MGKAVCKSWVDLRQNALNVLPQGFHQWLHMFGSSDRPGFDDSRAVDRCVYQRNDQRGDIHDSVRICLRACEQIEVIAATVSAVLTVRTALTGATCPVTTR